LQGQSFKANLKLNSLTIPSTAGTVIGNITTQPTQFNSPKTDPVVILQSTTKPNWQWRLLHPTKIF